MLFGKFCRKRRSLRQQLNELNHVIININDFSINQKSKLSLWVVKILPSTNQIVVEIAYYVRNILVNKQVLIQK